MGPFSYSVEGQVFRKGLVLSVKCDSESCSEKKSKLMIDRELWMRLRLPDAYVLDVSSMFSFLLHRFCGLACMARLFRFVYFLFSLLSLCHFYLINFSFFLLSCCITTSVKLETVQPGEFT